ncbi:MAG TPA: 2-oxoglutarate ferredoxin oxidoreductase subunit alpha, partial [Flavisolibacter sp.]
GLEHRIGGLEKQDGTGNVSYEPANHEQMTRLRAQKIQAIAQRIPDAFPDSGNTSGKLVVLGWGSTYGAIKTAVRELLDEGYDVSHVHLRYINPLPANLHMLLNSYDRILVPEMNCGQLLQLIRGKFLVPATGFNKVQGQPFTTGELKQSIIELYNRK